MLTLGEMEAHPSATAAALQASVVSGGSGGDGDGVGPRDVDGRGGGGDGRQELYLLNAADVMTMLKQPVPTPSTVAVIGCVCVLLGEPVSWRSATAFMADCGALVARLRGLRDAAFVRPAVGAARKLVNAHTDALGTGRLYNCGDAATIALGLWLHDLAVTELPDDGADTLDFDADASLEEEEAALAAASHADLGSRPGSAELELASLSPSPPPPRASAPPAGPPPPLAGATHVGPRAAPGAATAAAAAAAEAAEEAAAGV